MRDGLSPKSRVIGPTGVSMRMPKPMPYLNSGINPGLASVLVCRKLLVKPTKEGDFGSNPNNAPGVYLHPNTNKMVIFMNTHKALMEKIIDVLNELIIEHLSFQIKSGVDLIQIFDTHSNVLDYNLLEIYI